MFEGIYDLPGMSIFDYEEPEPKLQRKSIYSVIPGSIQSACTNHKQTANTDRGS